jgi:hypothetical protein
VRGAPDASSSLSVRSPPHFPQNPKENPMASAEAVRILNDKFRTRLVGGRVVMTSGIVGRSDVPVILARVATFEDFTADNDPYSEHDFGAFEHQGDTIFWKIDYYDPTMTGGAEDPSNPNLTTRVLTIMLAEEY